MINDGYNFRARAENMTRKTNSVYKEMHPGGDLTPLKCIIFVKNGLRRDLAELGCWKHIHLPILQIQVGATGPVPPWEHFQCLVSRVPSISAEIPYLKNAPKGSQVVFFIVLHNAPEGPKGGFRHTDPKCT